LSAAANLPRHVAVIMDGNGRWAKSRGLPRLAGHKAGVDSVREAVKACGELGVKYLTLYSFSTENWSRPAEEVGQLMKLLSWALRKETLDLAKNKVRLRAIGRLEGLPLAVQKELAASIKKLDHNKGLTLTLALNYGSRQEIVDAASKLACAGAAITEESLAAELYTGKNGVPDPDLVIRTSGELRLSNFLMWQAAYAEIYVTPTFWPDFRRPHLEEALAAYSLRQRRFGGIEAK
jgi:undecaprenyl diphosphate synthase